MTQCCTDLSDQVYFREVANGDVVTGVTQLASSSHLSLRAELLSLLTGASEHDPNAHPLSSHRPDCSK